jgi:hypothetical protein
MTETSVITTIEGERFVHKALWRTVERQLDHATEKLTGSRSDHLVAMVFAFHALEAYLNYVGERIAPDVWKDERDYFSRQPYRGFDGKMRKVLQLVEMPEPSREERPYSTVWLLKELRDLIAHGKPIRFTAVLEHSRDDEPLMFYSPVKDVVSPENAHRARDDIKDLIERIHAAAQPKVKADDDYYFRLPALDGPSAYNTSHSTVKRAG